MTSPIRCWRHWAHFKEDVRGWRYLAKLKRQRKKHGRCPSVCVEFGDQCSFPIEHPDHLTIDEEGLIIAEEGWCHMDYEHGAGVGWITEGSRENL